MSAIAWSAALSMLVAAGFGLPIPWVAWRLVHTGDLPSFVGQFPMYGGPLFRRVSRGTFVFVLASFAVVCLVDGLAGFLLWQGQRAGAWITLALLPLEVGYWIAFALPIPPLIGVVRLGLLVVGWSSLR